MNREWEMLSLLFGGGLQQSTVWLNVSVLAAFLLIILWKSDKVISPYLLKIAIFLFALSVALPGVLQLGSLLIMQGTSWTSSQSAFYSGGAGNDARVLLTMVGNGCQPILLGLAIWFLVLALLPKKERPAQPASRFAKKPVVSPRLGDAADDDDDD